jgi:2-phospho-L-lactate guanylyltransferase
MHLALLDGLTRRRGGTQGACVLVAIKARAHCKTRLAPTLPPAARLRLVRSMLAAVLSAAQAARTVREVIVVSPERDSVAAEIPVLNDTGECLNGALTEAHRVLRESGCCEVVVLPADLPTISGRDIDALVHAGRSGGFALAPDTSGSGTNALCLATAQTFCFRFGVNSRELHLEEARRLGLTAALVRRVGLEFDVDSPADLARVERQPWRARRQA